MQACACTASGCWWLDQLDRALTDVDRLDLRRDGLAVLVALAALLLGQEAARAAVEVDHDGVVAHVHEGTGHLRTRDDAGELQTALAEPHLLLLAVDVDDDELQLVAPLEARQLPVTLVPGTVDLADVQETHGRVAQVDERAGARLGAVDGALDDDADLQAREELGLLVGDQAEPEATGLMIDLDHAHLELLLVTQLAQEVRALRRRGAGHLGDVQQPEAELADRQVDAEVLLELDARRDGVTDLDGLEEGRLRRLRLDHRDRLDLRLDDRRRDDLLRLDRLDGDGRGDGRGDDDLAARLALAAGGALARVDLHARTPRLGEGGDGGGEVVAGLVRDRLVLGGLDDLGRSGGGGLGDVTVGGGVALGGHVAGDGDAGLGAVGADDGDGELGALGDLAELGAVERGHGQERGVPVDGQADAVLVLGLDDAADVGAGDEVAGAVVHGLGSFGVDGFDQVGGCGFGDETRRRRGVVVGRGVGPGFGGLVFHNKTLLSERPAVQVG